MDDHQTRNAGFLSQEQAAWQIPQNELTPEVLCNLIRSCDRPTLQRMAIKAQSLSRREATQHVVSACEEVLA